MNLAADFRTKYEVVTDRVRGELTCNPFDLAGRMNFKFVLKTKPKVLVGFRFRMAPQGFKVRATFGFAIPASFGTKQEIVEQRSIYKVPLAGVSIPGGIFNSGPRS